MSTDVAAAEPGFASTATSAGGSPEADHSAGHAGHVDALGHHVSSPATLLGVFAALMILTALTVLVYYTKTGIVVSMGIAAIKATLVGLYFMHLRYDRPFNGFVFASSLFFVALFIGFALMDRGQYQSVITEQEEVDLRQEIETGGTDAPE